MCTTHTYVTEKISYANYYYVLRSKSIKKPHIVNALVGLVTYICDFKAVFFFVTCALEV